MHCVRAQSSEACSKTLLLCYWQCNNGRVCVQVPIMLRSSYCSLHGHSNKGLTDLGECPYDQVGLSDPSCYPPKLKLELKIVVIRK